MAKTRFYKGTKGFNAEVIVANAAAYTTDADYKTFVANAVDGEIGIFDHNTGLLIGANVALVEGTKFFIAQKRNGGISKFTSSVFSKNTTTKRAYTAQVKQVSTIALAGYTPVVGDTVAIKVIETTPGYEQFPVVVYNYIVKTGDTPTIIATNLRAIINKADSLENNDDKKFVTASGSAANVVLTADFFGSSFRVAFPGKLYGSATATLTTPYKRGSGFYDEVANAEFEGQVYEGVTTQYPGDGFAAADFGSLPKYAVEGGNYDIYNFTPVKNEASPTSIAQHHHYWNGLLFVPAAGPIVAISTILGFTAVV